MPRFAWLTPDALPALEPVEYRLYVPNDPFFRAQLRGLLVMLTEEWHYEKFGELTPEQTASAWLALLATNLQLDEADNVVEGVPIGTICAFGGPTLPDNWLLCDGSEAAITDYPALYAVIGSTYGLATSTHFTLPDLRAKFVVGAGNGGMYGYHELGQSGGEKEVTLQIAHLPPHAHTLSVSNPASGTNLHGSGGGGTSRSTSTVGGGAPHNNLPPYLALTYCIYAGPGA